jgi:hypothetical protein
VHEDLSREAVLAIMRAARARSVPVVGHLPRSMTPEEMSNLGVKGIEHLEFIPDRCLVLFDSVWQASHRPAPPGCGTDDLDRLFRTLAGNNTWLDPTISSFRNWAPALWPYIFAGFKSMADIRNTRLMPRCSAAVG